MTINNRIDLIIKQFGLNKNSFSTKIGVNPTVIHNIIKGRNAPSFELLNKIVLTFDNINPEWLLTGEGPMLRGIKPDEINRFSSKADTYLHTVRIPLYNVEAIGGVVEVYDSIADTEPIAWLEIPNLPKCDGAIYMVGDSMYPLLKSGDIIIYKVLNDLQNILWGEMYLLSIAHNGDAFLTVKYVKQSDTPGYVTLISYNEHHQPKDFPFDSIRFAAHIKASVRINSMG
ncbi:S24 family peptidase [Tenuifilum osseticum]|uniref:S24 family peptidase n=1 Tax=Tenuifilum osseticum TaxID=3374723 RepID=UPI0034E5501E